MGPRWCGWEVRFLIFRRQTAEDRFQTTEKLKSEACRLKFQTIRCQSLLEHESIFKGSSIVKELKIA